jgi:hypothetical protein
MRFLSAVLALVASSCLLAACGSSGTKKISKNDLAKEAQSKFEAITRSGQFPKVRCPKDLEAKKGAKTRCAAGSGKRKIAITATVVAVDGNRTQLRFSGGSPLQTR